MRFDPPYYRAESFSCAAQNGVFHGFFPRLDCRLSMADNRAIVADAAHASLISLAQVHGAAVHALKEPPPTLLKGDGLVTDQAGLGLGILTADCAPVLFYGTKESGTPVIGAAHAGWQGALKGVLDNTVAAMERLGAQKQTMRAAVGPCIAKPSYEVQLDFIAPFVQEHQESERFFHTGAKEGHVFFDLAGYCAWRLARCGVRHVALLDRDTYVEDTLFFSYRRGQHRGEKEMGRQISVISIK